MKLLKVTSAVIATLAALMALAFVGSASATTLTGSGGSTLGSGTSIGGGSEGATILHPPIGDIKCEQSSFESSVVRAGGSTETAETAVSTFSFNFCNAEVDVLDPGFLEFHTQESSANNNATVTSWALEVTVTFAGFHCMFTTNQTQIGTLTGSANTGSWSTIDIAATIPRTGGRSGAFCGSTAAWTGSYVLFSPSVLNVD